MLFAPTSVVIFTLLLIFFACPAPAPPMFQVGGGSYTSTSLTGPSLDTAPPYPSSAMTAPPIATVSPLDNSFPPPLPVQATAQRFDQPTAAVPQPGVMPWRASGPPPAYFPVAFHWFYCRNVELRQIWQPFSTVDSTKLESAYQTLMLGETRRFDAFSV